MLVNDGKKLRSKCDFIFNFFGISNGKLPPLQTDYKLPQKKRNEEGDLKEVEKVENENDSKRINVINDDRNNNKIVNSDTKLK